MHRAMMDYHFSTHFLINFGVTRYYVHINVLRFFCVWFKIDPPVNPLYSICLGLKLWIIPICPFKIMQKSTFQKICISFNIFLVEILKFKVLNKKKQTNTYIFSECLQNLELNVWQLNVWRFYICFVNKQKIPFLRFGAFTLLSFVVP